MVEHPEDAKEDDLDFSDPDDFDEKSGACSASGMYEIMISSTYWRDQNAMQSRANGNGYK